MLKEVSLASTSIIIVTVLIFTLVRLISAQSYMKKNSQEKRFSGSLQRTHNTFCQTLQWLIYILRRWTWHLWFQQRAKRLRYCPEFTLVFVSFRCQVDHHRLPCRPHSQGDLQLEQVNDFSAYGCVLASLHPEAQHTAKCIVPEHLARQLMRGM